MRTKGTGRTGPLRTAGWSGVGAERSGAAAGAPGGGCSPLRGTTGRGALPASGGAAQPRCSTWPGMIRFGSPPTVEWFCSYSALQPPDTPWAAAMVDRVSPARTV